MTKARLKWATKQHPEAELLLFEFCSHFFIFHIFSHSRASRIQSFFIGNHGAQQYFSAFHGPSLALATPKQHWKHSSWVSQATVRFSWKKVFIKKRVTSLILIQIATLRIWEKLLWFVDVECLKIIAIHLKNFYLVKLTTLSPENFQNTSTFERGSLTLVAFKKV